MAYAPVSVPVSHPQPLCLTRETAKPQPAQGSPPAPCTETRISLTEGQAAALASGLDSRFCCWRQPGCVCVESGQSRGGVTGQVPCRDKLSKEAGRGCLLSPWPPGLYPPARVFLWASPLPWTLPTAPSELNVSQTSLPSPEGTYSPQ